MRISVRAIPVLLLVLAAIAPASAQDPVRLPTVSVKASALLPGPRLLTGIVVDTAGNTIVEAEVTIPELRRRMFSSEDGTFRFDSIPRGEYSMRARKLGYAPQVRKFAVDTAGGTAEFQLLPLAHSLPPVVSTVERGGLGGVVGDTAFNPVRGAEVHVMGQGLSTQTDSLGAFFFPVLAGNYFVSIKKTGFVDRLVSVTVPADSGRRISAWLQPRVGSRPRDEAWNVADFQARLAWAPVGVQSGATFYTRDQLIKLRIEWIYDAVELTRPTNGQTIPYERDCSVLVNGGPATASLANLTIDDVEAIEVYGRHALAKMPTGFITKWQIIQGPAKQAATSSNSRNAAFDNRNKSCPTIYVWLR